MRYGVILLLLITFSAFGQDVKWEVEKLSYKAKLNDEGTPFVFKFKNSSDKEISIEKIKSSCSCMSIKTKFPFKVKAGGEAAIEAYYNFTGKVGFNRGNVEVVIDGKRKALAVEVDIPVPVTIEPRFIIWKKGERDSKEIKVALHPDWKGKITGVKSSVESIVAEMKEAKEGLKITVTPPTVDKLAKKRTWLLVNGVDEKGAHKEYRVYLILN